MTTAILGNRCCCDLVRVHGLFTHVIVPVPVTVVANFDHGDSGGKPGTTVFKKHFELSDAFFTTDHPLLVVAEALTFRIKVAVTLLVRLVHVLGHILHCVVMVVFSLMMKQSVVISRSLTANVDHALMAGLVLGLSRHAFGVFKLQFRFGVTCSLVMKHLDGRILGIFGLSQLSLAGCELSL